MADTLQIPIVGAEAVAALQASLDSLQSAVGALFQDGDALLTEREVAAICRVSERTVKNWRETDSGPRFVKCGASVRYRREALRAWLMANEFQSTTESEAA